MVGAMRAMAISEDTTFKTYEFKLPLNVIGQARIYARGER